MNQDFAMLLKVLLICYLIVMNVLAFAFMGIDKKRAVSHKWRIKESTLFLLAAFGGSVGAIFGMLVFHHKTKHTRFSVGMPVILISQILMVHLFCQLR